MTSDWYYTTHGEKHGPVSASTLKQLVTTGTIGPEDLLWQAGMPVWVPARDVKGLFPSLLSVDPSALPPVPAHQRKPSPPPSAAPAGPSSTPPISTHVSGASNRITDAANIMLSGVKTVRANAGDFVRSDAVRSRTAAVKRKWFGLTRTQQVIVGSVTGMGLLAVILIVGSVGLTILGLGNEPTCKEFLQKIATLQGVTEWGTQEIDGGPESPPPGGWERWIAFGMDPPKKFSRWERHLLQTGEHIFKDFEVELGKPNEKVPDYRYGDNYHVWIYTLSDGEVRVPIDMYPMAEEPFGIICAPGVEVFYF